MIQAVGAQLLENWLQNRMCSGVIKMGDEKSKSKITRNIRVHVASFSRRLPVASVSTCTTMFEHRLSVTCGKLIDVSSTISTVWGRFEP